jgi:hypothetical protein
LQRCSSKVWGVQQWCSKPDEKSNKITLAAVLRYCSAIGICSAAAVQQTYACARIQVLRKLEPSCFGRKK